MSTSQENKRKCLQEHLDNIERSMAAIKSLLGTDHSKQDMPRKMTKREKAELKYRRYLRGIK